VRDVVVLSGGRLLVSKFRTAQVLVVDNTGKIVDRKAPPRFAHLSVHLGQNFDPAIAWRMLPTSGDGALLLHQRGMADSLGAYPQGYYAAIPGPCSSSIVHTTVTPISVGNSPPAQLVLQGAVLPVDGAVSSNGSQIAVVAAGNVAPAPRLYVAAVASFTGGGGCLPTPAPVEQPPGEPTAVAWMGNEIVVQTREPASLFLANAKVTIGLSAVSRVDVGHAIFHHDAGGNIACASCHAEGGEDGRVWVLNVGPRRTQSIRGGLSGTEPFHWAGDVADFTTLVHDVYVVRMLGPQLDANVTKSLQRWTDAIPSLPKQPAADPAAVQRGLALFNSKDVGCATCHSGPRFTNRSIVNVGTGGSFKVPRLVNVAWRAPFMHAGCAPTLHDRFGNCGGGDQHGTTSKLMPNQVDDLVAYLETL
jgi:mono/diheme cytochrome c family protein